MRVLACLCILRVTQLCICEDPQAGLVDSFQSGGWALSRRLLEVEEVQNVSSTVKQLLTEHGRRAFGDKDTKEVRFTFAVHELDSTVAKFVAKRGRLWQEAASLAGTEKLCLLMDRGFSKDPGDPETHWHRDDEAIGLPRLHPHLRTVHAWIPLSAMGKQMGTLQYLLGTHRRTYGVFERFLASLWGWEFAWFATAHKAQDDALELGDVAWHDGWILHSAGSNSAGAVRDGLAISYAYCNTADGCNGADAPVSDENPTCRAADVLFDAEWKERHRRGENDYLKTEITDPMSTQVLRFLWRSGLGAMAGLAVHGAFTRFANQEDKNKTE